MFLGKRRQVVSPGRDEDVARQLNNIGSSCRQSVLGTRSVPCQMQGASKKSKRVAQVKATPDVVELPGNVRDRLDLPSLLGSLACALHLTWL